MTRSGEPAGDVASEAARPLRVCLRCGFTIDEFRARGLLGCAECYDRFGETLFADMLHAHPRLYRTAPHRAGEDGDVHRAESAAALRERLADALRFERYEEAAALRRELESLAGVDSRAGGAKPPRRDDVPLAPPDDDAVARNATARDNERADDDFLAGLAGAPVSWAAPPAGMTVRTDDDFGATENARVLFVRMVARRNFPGYPFWVSCAPETCAALLPLATEAARAAGLRGDYRLAALDAEQRGLLRERMLLPARPVSFAATRDHKRLWVETSAANGLRTHALLGEVEHWTLVRTWGPRFPSPAKHPPHAPPPFSLDALDALDALTGIATRDAAADTSRFAHAETWGFLNSHPAHAGHGLQFEAGLHLPSLAEPAAHETFLQVRQALGATGYDLQVLSRPEPGATEPGFFRLVSRGGAGVTAEEAAMAFAERTRSLLRVETDLWERRRAREPGVLEDRMHRALRVLQEARRLEEAEARRLVSHARTGVYAGAFPAALLGTLETFRVQAQPYHVRAFAALETGGAPATPGGAREAAADDIAVRARLARRLLSPP